MKFRFVRCTNLERGHDSVAPVDICCQRCLRFGPPQLIVVVVPFRVEAR